MRKRSDIPVRVLNGLLGLDPTALTRTPSSARAMINVCGLVGHSATRFTSWATVPSRSRRAEEIGALPRWPPVGEEGALGFSVNRHPGHTLADRRPIRARRLPRGNLAIARAVGARGAYATVRTSGKSTRRWTSGEEANRAALLFSASASTASARRKGPDNAATASTSRGHRPRSGAASVARDQQLWRTRWNELRKMDSTPPDPSRRRVSGQGCAEVPTTSA